MNRNRSRGGGGGAAGTDFKGAAASGVVRDNMFMVELTGPTETPDAPTNLPDNCDPHFLSRQPISPIQMASMITRDIKLLTPEQNALFGALDADTRQIVLMCPIPAANLDHAMGLFNLSCIQKSDVTFTDFAMYDEQGELLPGCMAKETMFEISRDEILRRVTYLCALNAANMGLLPVVKSEEASRAFALKVLKSCQEHFRDPLATWDTLGEGEFSNDPELSESRPWPFFLEVITDGHDASSSMGYMLHVIVRARNPLERLRNAQLILDSYTARRYYENVTAIHGKEMGYRANQVDPQDAAAMAAVLQAAQVTSATGRPGAAPARRPAPPAADDLMDDASNGSNGTRVKREPPRDDAAGVRRAMDAGATRDPPAGDGGRNRQRTRTGKVGKQFAAKYGLCLDEVPSYRNGNGMFFATWEHLVASICPEHWHNSGVTVADVNNLYRFNLKGTSIHRVMDADTLGRKEASARNRAATGSDDDDSDSDADADGATDATDGQITRGAVDQNDPVAAAAAAAYEARGPAAAPKLSYLNQLFTRRGFAVPGARRRDSAFREPFSLSNCGVYAKPELDFRQVGQLSTANYSHEYIYPWHVFSPLARVAWSTGGIVSVDQMDVRNYFREMRTAPLPLGPNTAEKSMDRVLLHWMQASAVNLANRDSSTVNKSTMSAYLYVNEAGVDPLDPVEIGSLFKGFPHPDRVYWLSPMFTMPWTAPLIPLPPARGNMESYEWDKRASKDPELAYFGKDWSTVYKTVAYADECEDHRARIVKAIREGTVYSDKPQLFHLMRHALHVIWPSNEEEFKLAKSRAAQIVVLESPENFAERFNDIDLYFRKPTREDALAQFINEPMYDYGAAGHGTEEEDDAKMFAVSTITRALLCRLLLRLLYTESVGMMRFWGTEATGATSLPMHGKRTLDSIENRDFKDMNPRAALPPGHTMMASDSLRSCFRLSAQNVPVLPGFFDSENAEVYPDHLSVTDCERLFEATDKQNEELVYHLSKSRSKTTFRFFMLPFPLLKVTSRGMAPWISTSKHVTSAKAKEKLQAEIYEHVVRPMPEDMLSAENAARHLELTRSFNARNRSYAVRGAAAVYQELDPYNGDAAVHADDLYAHLYNDHGDARVGGLDTRAIYADASLAGDASMGADSDAGDGRAAANAAMKSASEAKTSLYDYTVPSHVNLTPHNGYIQVGVLQSTCAEPYEKLREETSWSEFAGNHSIKRGAYIKNMTRPVSLFIIRLQEIIERFKPTPGRTEHVTWSRDAVTLLRGATTAVQYMQAFEQLFASQSLLPAFYGEPRVKKRAANIFCMSNNGSVQMPQAFDSAFSAWTSSVGQCANTQIIPFKSFLRDWNSLQTPHATMIASLTQAMSVLGIGANGTADKLNYGSLVYASIMTAPVLSRDRLRLHSLNVIQAGQHASSKSHSTYLVHELFLPTAISACTSNSSLALNASAINNDGYAIYLDEGDASQSEDVNKESDLKNAWSNGYLVRNVVTADHAQRKVVSSHRCPVVWNVNFSQDLIKAPLASRAVLVLSPAIQTDSTQSYGSSFANYAGHSAAENVTIKKLETNKVGAPWRMLHGVKYILETLIYAGCLEVDIRTATELSTVLMSRFKDKVDSGSATPRITSLLSLLMRSEVTTYASYMICMEWYSHYMHRAQDRQFSVIPIGFILSAAPKWLFATKGIACYCITLLFDQLVNNKQHVDATRGILTAAKLYNNLIKPDASIFDPALNVPFLLRPITATQADASLPGAATADAAEGNLPATELRYSNDPRVYTSQAPASDAEDPDARFALDMNYAVLADSSIQSYDALMLLLYKRMPVDYGLHHLKTLIKQLTTRTFEADKHDVNKISAHLYEALLRGQASATAGHSLSVEATSAARIGTPGPSSFYPEASSDESDRMVTRSTRRQREPPGQADAGYIEEGIRMIQTRVAAARTQGTADTRAKKTSGAAPAGPAVVAAPTVRASDMPRPLVTGLSSITLVEAAKHRLPLMHYARESQLPILEIISVDEPSASRSRTHSRGKPKTRFILAISVRYVQEVIQLMCAIENVNHLKPTPSEMGNIIEAALAKVDTVLPYPPTVYMQWYNKHSMCIDKARINPLKRDAPLLHQPMREIIPTGVTTSITKTQLSQLTASLVDTVLAKSPHLRQCSKLHAFMKTLPDLVRMHGTSFGVRDIVTSDFVTDGKYSLQFSANLSETYQSRASDIQVMLQRSSRTSLEHIAGRYAGPSRQIVCIAEAIRAQLGVGQDIRACAYSPDWEAFKRSCALKTPPVDPLNFMNQVALPMITKHYFCIRAGIKIKQRKAKAGTAAEPTLAAAAATTTTTTTTRSTGKRKTPSPSNAGRKRAKLDTGSPAPITRRLVDPTAMDVDIDVDADAIAGAGDTAPGESIGDARDAETGAAMQVDAAEPDDDHVEADGRRDMEHAVAMLSELQLQQEERRLEIERAETASARTGLQSASTQQALKSANLSCRDSDLPYPMNVYAGQLRYQIWLLFFRHFLDCADTVADCRPAFWAKKGTAEWLLHICTELARELAGRQPDDDELLAAGV